jgi:tetratricopeptide (TPR) repeat protein
MRHTLVLVVAAVVLASRADAQAWKKPPQRPRDATISDTNDARQYLDYAIRVFDREPDNSAKGFYWAARLDPTLADAFYGQRSALILASAPLLRFYVRGGRKARESKEIRALDSLYWRALTVNPFLYRRFDQRMLMYYLKEEIERSSPGASDQPSPSEIEFVLQNWMRTGDNDMRAWYQYSNGNFPNALARYADAMKREKKKAWYHVERGRIFGMLNTADSAVAEFNAALEEMRADDRKDLVVLYDSKAVVEHSVGIMLESKGDRAGAREAFGRAMQEDLAFYPANVRLGLLSLQENDTSAALASLDLAAQSAKDDPWVHYVYGFTLSSVGRSADAVGQYQEALRLEPFWALPHAALGDVLARDGKAAEAKGAYATFLSLASRVAPRRAEIERKVASMTTSP